MLDALVVASIAILRIGAHVLNGAQQAYLAALGGLTKLDVVRGPTHNLGPVIGVGTFSYELTRKFPARGVERRVPRLVDVMNGCELGRRSITPVLMCENAPSAENSEYSELLADMVHIVARWETLEGGCDPWRK